jgi:CDP-diacylglycerol--glycerol-3-phosphate 3-phosphatidyltransferase
VSDFGKLFDPFADTLLHLTLFLAFVADGILGIVPFLVILWRELSVQFLRNLLLRKKGVAQGARWMGKVKTETYFLTCAVSPLNETLDRLEMTTNDIVYVASNGLFCIAAIMAVISFADYYKVYKKA